MSDIDKIGDKIDAMSGMIHEMKPILVEVREDQKAFDVRIRSVENQGVEHKIKIERIQDDMDGLGRRVRGYIGDPRTRGEPRGGKWLEFLEVLSVVPRYWHFLFGAVGIIAGILGVTLRHK